jgi:Glycosyl hydrolases family 15
MEHEGGAQGDRRRAGQVSRVRDDPPAGDPRPAALPALCRGPARLREAGALRHRLITQNGFLPAEDPRLPATVLAVADELSEHGYVLRYRTEETDDGLSGKEGSFVICSFWLVSALAIVGETQRARDLMVEAAARLVVAEASRKSPGEGAQARLTTVRGMASSSRLASCALSSSTCRS